MLCEDRQHEAFLRRFFRQAGWNRNCFRVEISPKGRGAGEQWVREQFPTELKELRRCHVSVHLVAITDADRSTVAERKASFDETCRTKGVDPRSDDEPVALLVPRRNIETWIAYLGGENVDEDKAYPKLSRESKCAPAVERLTKMCRKGDLRKPAPPSLEDACEEYTARMVRGAR